MIMYGPARHHMSIPLSGATAGALDALRSVWDPAMLRIAPAHVTVVYPEETVDAGLLLDRLARAAAELAPFRIRLGALSAERDGHGGVFAHVEDPDGGLDTLRDRLLLPPQRYGGHPFHTTIAHPRTAPDPARCWRSLRERSLDGEHVVDEVQWTVTDDTGRTVLRRFRLTSPAAPGRVAMAGGIVVDDGRLLLGLRRRDNPRYPGVWDLPGGRVEHGESPRRALRRELVEELGVDAELDGPWRRVVDDGLGVELSLWVVRRWRGAIVNAGADEHERLAWFAPPDLDALPLPHPSYPALLTAALHAGGAGHET